MPQCYCRSNQTTIWQCEYLARDLAGYQHQVRRQAVNELIDQLLEYHKVKSRHLLDLETGIDGLPEDDNPQQRKQKLQTLFSVFQNNAEESHHHNEELILSELRRTDAPIHRRVEEISADHKAFNRIADDISKKLSSESVSPGDLYSVIGHFIETYKDHANGEETIFFPIAERYLRKSHWSRIKKAWR